MAQTRGFHNIENVTLFTDSFQEKTEEEWKEIEKDLKPVIEEIEEDTENRQSPESLIGDEETVDRYVGGGGGSSRDIRDTTEEHWIGEREHRVGAWGRKIVNQSMKK